MVAETLIVGAASGFNPLMMAATDGSELITDVPFWWGGASIAGWALRPVPVKVDAQQASGCDQQIWQEEACVSLIPWKTLASYSKEDRRHKDVQLGVNLARALTEIAESASRELRLKPCEQGTSEIGFDGQDVLAMNRALPDEKPILPLMCERDVRPI